MAEHNCIQEKQIGEITAILGRISKEVYGNGDAGLIKTIPRLEEKINNLVGSVSSHTKIISNFIEFQATHNGEEKGKKDNEARALVAQELQQTQRRDMWYRILTILGLAVAIYFGVVNSYKNSDLNKRILDMGTPVVTNSRGETVPLPADAKVKYWPKDFMGDTTTLNK